MALSVFPVPSSGFDQTKITLRQTVTSGTSVTIPAGITQVYAILVGGGGGGAGGGGGGGAGTSVDRSGGGGGGVHPNGDNWGLGGQGGGAAEGGRSACATRRGKKKQTKKLTSCFTGREQRR